MQRFTLAYTPHFIAQLFAEQRMHRLAGGLRADVHDRKLERAQYGIRGEPAERMRIDGDERHRLIERRTRELRQQPVQARELHFLPALQRRLA